jgi:hypothetical protein
VQKVKNRKFKKPYIKMVLDSKKWDSDRWDGWEIILGSIPHFFRGIWSNKTSQTLFLAVMFSIFRLLFRQYRLGVEKIEKHQSQCSQRFSKKSIPGLFYSKPPRKVSVGD